LPYFRTSDQTRIYFEDVGEGFPILFLHPWPTDHAMWMFQVPVFSERYRLITPDSRGLGKSDRPQQQGKEKESCYSLRRLSDDVDESLEYLRVDRAFIVGNSLGGAVAERFAIDHPEKVEATVWVGAPTFPLDELLMEDFEGRKGVPFSDIYLGALRSSGYLGFWNSVWKPLMSYQFHESFVKNYIGSYLVRYLFEERYARLNSDPRGVISILEGLRAETKSLDEDLSRLEMPSAIVCGDGDDTRPACEKQHAAIPKARFLVIQNSGHFCYMDQPRVFNEFLSDFLSFPKQISGIIEGEE
jgi:non-heme chloroperoxidase